MDLKYSDLKALHDHAVTAAKRAAKYISDAAQKHEMTPLKTEYKSAGNTLASQVVTQVDFAADRLIRDLLGNISTHYDLAFLTEESTDDKSRFEKEYFWCVDPLDGTLAFIEGRAGYAVSISLVSRLGKPLIGVVCDVVSRTIYSAIYGHGCYRGGKPWKVCLHSNGDGERLKTFSFVCDGSFKKLDCYEPLMNELEALVLNHGYSVINHLVGSGAVMNALRILNQAPGIYLKLPKRELGGGSVWDFAATTAIFHGQSMVTGDVFGEALNLNPKEGTFMNHCGVLFLSDPKLRDSIFHLLGKYSSS